MQNFGYLLLSLFGLGFLVFIHELGHFWMARRVGMTVEAFSIGFGKSIFAWESKGVKWRIGWLPFGGYVKIAGMDKSGGLEPYQIPDGFFGKSPKDRIKVAVMGPLVNIAFAFLCFFAMWTAGGMLKPFSYFTKIIGSVSPESNLIQCEVRPGDEIDAVDGKKIDSLGDLHISFLLNGKQSEMNGYQIDYLTQKRQPFSCALNSNLKGQRAFNALGIYPANYLIYQAPLSPDSSLAKSGMQSQDRVLWVDGTLIFSQDHLKQVINEPKTLLTLQRDNQVFLSRVPCVKMADIDLDYDYKSDVDDWRHESGLTTHTRDLLFIPYGISTDGIVEAIGRPANLAEPAQGKRTGVDIPLEEGDQILAVNGTPVSNSYELLQQLQKKQAVVIVQRQSASPVLSSTVADQAFESSFNPKDLLTLMNSVGNGSGSVKSGDLYLLPPIALTPSSAVPANVAFYAAQKRQIEKIPKAQDREQHLQAIENLEKQLVFGMRLEDRVVNYNPSPPALFFHVLDQTWKSLVGLISGHASPKNMTGPIGIVEVMQQSWTHGVNDALYWLGFISLNLAIFNLLPVPVLDGGHILFAAIESVTKKPIKAKTMQKLVFPFILLVVALFIYITYQDLARLLSRFL